MLILCAANANALGTPNQTATRASLIQLISTPEKFDGKLVRLIGAVQFEFEGNELCFHKEDLENSISENCLWLSLEKNMLETTNQSLSEFNGNYVIIEGVFKKNNKGHRNLFSGSIESINRLHPWQIDKEKRSRLKGSQ